MINPQVIKTSEDMKALCADDPGIDYNNYSLEEEIERIKDIKVAKYFGILVRIHIEPAATKSEGGIYYSDTTIEKNQVRNKFTRPIGLVLKFSNGVFKDEDRYKLTGPLCAIGDWIEFERSNVRCFAWNDRVYGTLMEDHCNLILKGDPRQYKKINE